MARSRSRHQSGGGGIDLGQLLAMALGGGEENPAFGAEGPGGVSPDVKNPEKAMAKFGTTNPYKPNSFLQRLYGMNDADRANMGYRVGQIEAADALNRELGAVGPRGEAQTKAKIASDEALLAAEARRMVPSMQRLAGQGALPDMGIESPIDPNTPEGALIHAQEMLRRYGPNGLYSILQAGEADRLKMKKIGGEMPGAEEEARVLQSARTAEGRLGALSAGQETDVRESNQKDVKKGILAHLKSPLRASVGGVLIPDITDPTTWFSATPETRGGIDLETGQMTEPSAPRLLQVTPHGVIQPRGRIGGQFPNVTPSAPNTGVPAASPARPTPAPTVLKPSFSGGLNAPSMGAQAILPVPKTPEEMLAEQVKRQADAEAAKRRLLEMFQPRY